jgi:hypothetical protein
MKIQFFRIPQPAITYRTPSKTHNCLNNTFKTKKKRSPKIMSQSRTFSPSNLTTIMKYNKACLSTLTDKKNTNYHRLEMISLRTILRIYLGVKYRWICKLSPINNNNLWDPIILQKTIIWANILNTKLGRQWSKLRVLWITKTKSNTIKTNFMRIR